MKRNRAFNTDPMPTPADTGYSERVPEPESAFEDDPMDPRTESILKALDRPPRPPAPAPEHRSSSEGGEFVAYSAVARPAGSAAGLAEPQRQGASELAVIVQQTQPGNTAPWSSRDAPTVTARFRQEARLLRWVLMSLAAGGLLAGIGVMMGWHAASKVSVAPEREAPAATAAPIGTQETERLQPLTDNGPQAESLAPPVAPTISTNEHEPMARAPSRATPRPTTVPLPVVATPPAVRPPTGTVAPAARSTSDRLVEHPW